MLMLLTALALGAADPKAEATALGIIDDLKAGNADAAKARLGSGAAAIPPQALVQSWKKQAEPLGAFTKVELLKAVEQGRLLVFTHAVKFEKGVLMVTAAVDRETLKIESFGVRPPASALPAAEYVKPDAFTATDVTFGAPSWEVGGTLTVPKDAKTRLPAVVLVHAAGPLDRDEAVGANRPFKDLAEGLSSRGVVVLRYDKRTFVHGKRMTPVVKLDDEVVSDALAGLELLARQPQVDPKKVYVLGHALGAQLAPEIAARSKVAAGAVLLAPPARKPCEVIIERLGRARQAQLLDEVKATCAKLKTGKAEGKLLGAPVEYWHELTSKDGIAAAKKLGKPLLVLHAERDDQASPEDAAAWVRGLAGVKSAAVSTVPRANHLFIEGEGASTPAEYGRPGHLAAAVVERVAAFTSR